MSFRRIYKSDWNTVNSDAVQPDIGAYKKTSRLFAQEAFKI